MKSLGTRSLHCHSSHPKIPQLENVVVLCRIFHFEIKRLSDTVWILSLTQLWRASPIHAQHKFSVPWRSDPKPPRAPAGESCQKVIRGFSAFPLEMGHKVCPRAMDCRNQRTPSLGTAWKRGQLLLMFLQKFSESDMPSDAVFSKSIFCYESVIPWKILRQLSSCYFFCRERSTFHPSRNSSYTGTGLTDRKAAGSGVYMGKN